MAKININLRKLVLLKKYGSFDKCGVYSTNVCEF